MIQGHAIRRDPVEDRPFYPTRRPESRATYAIAYPFCVRYIYPTHYGTRLHSHHKRDPMADNSIHAVTGAYGYSGQYIARRLLAAGHRVITLTNSLGRANSFGGAVGAFSFDFDRPDVLAEHLRGVSVLYNTYWVRFNHRLFTHSDAVANTLVLFEAAKQAGVQRIVHISIANPSKDSPLEYYRSKAALEKALSNSGVSHAILRPTVLFGKEDILINNIAWTLRRLPVFGVFGNGRYHIQPVYVDDLARMAVEQGESRENVILNAVGPEKFVYRDFIAMIARTLGRRRLIVPTPPWLGYAMTRMIGKLVGDVIITRDEIKGLMADLLHVDTPPTGTVVLSDWVRDHADTLGRRYASELARREDRRSAYEAM